MIADQRRFDSIDQISESPQVLPIQRIHGTDRESNAMQRDRIVPSHGLEHSQGAALRVDVILGNGFEPVDPLRARENIFVVIGAQAGAEPQPGLVRRRTRAPHTHGFTPTLSRE